MITPAYLPTATERVLPRLALDFTTGVLDPRVTVTRALNTATCVNSSGLIVGVNADLPRFDYNPVTLAARGLLIEETRANFFLRSAEFNGASWTRTASGVNADATTSPDGTTNADKLTADATAGLHFIRQNVAVSAGAHTFSVYAKAGEYTAIWVTLDGASNYAIFTLSGAGSSTATTGTASISAAGNGWYRCVFTQTLAAGTAGCFIGTSNPAGTLSFTGDGTSGVFLYGAQLEAGAFATSYIPTTTTSLTRNADVVSMTGTNFSSWYNASQGSFLVQGDLLSGAFPSSANLLSVADNANADFMRFWVWNGAANTLRWAGSEAGPSQFDLTRPYTANTTFKALGVYKVNDFAFGVDGGALVTDNAGTVITSADKMILGSKTGFVEFMSGHLAKILYWPQRVLNAEIQSFSK